METKKTPYRSASEMFVVIENLLASEQSQKQFCQEQNISTAVLHYWMRKYRLKQKLDHGEDFLRVHVNESEQMGAGVEIIYSDGTRLRISGEMKTEQIRRMLPVFSQR